MSRIRRHNPLMQRKQELEDRKKIDSSDLLPRIIHPPSNPPNLEHSFIIHRVVEIIILAEGSTYWKYGSPSEPTIRAIAPSPNGTYTGFITMEVLVNIFNHSLIRTSLVGPATGQLSGENFNIFSVVRCNSVKIWGPVNDENAGIPVELTLARLQLLTNHTGESRSGYFADATAARTVRANGDRLLRARVALSIPQSPWLPFNAQGFMLSYSTRYSRVLAYEIGFSNSTSWTPIFGDPIATIHVSLSGQITQPRQISLA